MADNPSISHRLAQIRRLRASALAQADAICDQPLDENHPLARAVGLDRAEAILSPRPTPFRARWAERRAIVARRMAEGATLTQIARELNVTPSRIWQLRKALGL